MGQRVDDQLLPSPTVCDIHDQDGNELLPSNVRNNTKRKMFELTKLAVYLKIKQTYLKTSDISAEERRKLATATLTATFVTHLVIQNVRLDFNALINVSMLQLNEASRDGCNIALLVRESNSASALNKYSLKLFMIQSRG